MAEIVQARKNLTTNPLKSSAPLGAALAYLGIEGAVPLLHGAQGCTSFALVLTVRHTREAIPLQTTALDEIATVMGGADNLEQALLNLTKRMKPRFIGIATTALTETRGEEMDGDLRLILGRRPELSGVRVVLAHTPDFAGGLEDGWARAVSAIIDAMVEPADGTAAVPPQVNLLPGVHQTAADIEWMVETAEAFGLTAVVLPDVSGSLDGTVPEQYTATSYGGTRLESIAHMGRARHTIAIGEHMRAPAERLAARTGVPVTVLPTLTGLGPADAFVALLADISGRPVPPRLRRQRSQLVDAMLDGHFQFGGRRVAIAADPDLLCSLAGFFASMGAEVMAAVASTANAPHLDAVPTARVVVGDLMDFEDLARDSEAELLVTHSHGRQAADRLGVPLLRVGYPMFDRLGALHRCTAGYRGTRDFIFEISNIVLAGLHAHGPDDFPGAVPPMPATIEEIRHAGAPSHAH
ncbi:Nitrogenase iron-molybdenum cofactor biosynthesis protein NifN [Rhodovastum atsumiense]|uniref:Nitrogenase iron-molybdenum cofactor biosynthesis protein NifN n=1 Tax=Rhodovastum atsumiense TaxID=504468 RepID=A0A5M6J1W8_9PROT|nr:nitrogenase iron-molybdenum cofactor biosynthesis protein NifN [Rhodovastum atsumiense]KAA5613625.1 nitrogenase iron-molybdenum cofactor biosynthesis protein NifN [Rhodovastum atsumiense]CAH2599529.1 Nitrogenase iron-molybdenum cofactor biosynthesis protein NifN [Rhodovastum atsumiense]